MLPIHLITGLALAHGGGLDSHGCHHQRSIDGYHCHRSTWHAPASSHPEPTKEASHEAPTSIPRSLTASAMAVAIQWLKATTFSILAQSYNLAVDQLSRWSHLDHPENIEVGAELPLEEHLRRTSQATTKANSIAYTENINE